MVIVEEIVIMNAAISLSYTLNNKRKEATTPGKLLFLVNNDQ